MRATMITRRGAATRGDAQAARAARDSGARTLQARHRRPPGEGCPNLWRPDETSYPPAQVSPTASGCILAAVDVDGIRGGA